MQQLSNLVAALGKSELLIDFPFSKPTIPIIKFPNFGGSHPESYPVSFTSISQNPLKGTLLRTIPLSYGIIQLFQPLDILCADLVSLEIPVLSA